MERNAKIKIEIYFDKLLEAIEEGTAEEVLKHIVEKISDGYHKGTTYAELDEEDGVDVVWFVSRDTSSQKEEEGK